MHNQVTLHADRVLQIYNPELAEQVKHLIVVNATNEKNLWAIDNMLAIIENSRSFGIRRRPLREATVNCLVRLATITVSRILAEANNLAVKRAEFANLLGNDYNILRYWGFITPGEVKGTWLLTQLGLRFLCGEILVPDAIICHGGSHTRNYSFDAPYNMVSIASFIDFAWEAPKNILKRAEDPDDKLQIPLGEPLPTIVIKEK